MTEIDEMLVRIERAIDYFEKHTDDLGMPIFLRDIAKILILTKASAEGAGSLLLDVQQDCIKEHQRAEAAEKRVKELEPVVTMREQELMRELVRERGLVQVSHKRETALRDLLMRFIPADRHDEARAALEDKS